MSQQQQQQQTVIVNAGPSHGKQAYPQNIRDWSTGLCGCFEDCGSCCYAYLLFQCYLCSLAGHLQENCCVPIFLQGGLMALRTKTRTMYGIRGNVCEDWCYTTYCPQLSACQMDRELRNSGF